MIRSALLLFLGCVFCIAGPLAARAAMPHADLAKLTLQKALERLKSRGLNVLYSSDLIKPWMRVRNRPRATTPEGILAEIVQPYDLAVKQGPNGSVILIRGTKPKPAAKVAPTVVLTPVAAEPPPPDLAEIIVSASRYELLRQPSPSATVFTSEELDLLPEIGQDPLRALARIPGTARREFTAKPNIRGGETDETLVRFDGLRLYEPFHLKDFQSVFSTIDQSIIDGMNVYTGGFPVRYGDRMSGVADIQPITLQSDREREIAVSFFNTSGMAAGRFNDGKGEWLVSGRRGNLDLVLNALNSGLGDPRYFDLYGRVGNRFSDTLGVTASFLVFDDNVRLFEDKDREEKARANYRDAYYWLSFDLSPGDRLLGSVHLAHTSLHSRRMGSTSKSGISAGRLDDRRRFTIDTVRTDWSWRPTDRLLLEFGGKLASEKGWYSYRDQVRFFMLFRAQGAPRASSRLRALDASPDGIQTGIYGNFRLNMLDQLTAEFGLRWDRETLSHANDGQLSPRFALLSNWGRHTSLRLSWGRFFQSQSINELQISDGVTAFSPAQRADHLIASVEYRHTSGIDVRLEAFRKDYRHLRPRYENLLNTFILLPELKPDRIRIAPDKATAKGVELSLRKSGPGALSWWLSYNWSSTRDDFGATGAHRAWNQARFASAGIGWRNERWELSVAGTDHTGWPTTAVRLVERDPIPVVATGTPNAQHLRSYRAVDFRIARKFQDTVPGDLTVFLEVSNTFNRSNACCAEYEVTDIGGAKNLAVQSLNGLPVVPSVGFSWKF